MDEKKFKAIKTFIKDQSGILNDIFNQAVLDYESKFDKLEPFEKEDYGWSIDDQEAEAEANK